MRVFVAALLAATVVTGRAYALDPPACAVPSHLLSSDSRLKRVSATVAKQHALTVAVVGTGSSVLGGPEGQNLAYPARLENALRERLPAVALRVAARVKPGQTAEMMKRGMKTLLAEEKPDLVVWQVGTIDAMRRIGAEDFRIVVDDGVEALRTAGVDVILMNAQFSPRTESMIAVSPYLENMRVVAQQRDIPLFDRFAIMRYWSDYGAFDFYAAGRDNALARRVHDCIGRAIATLIMDTARLKPEAKAGQ